MKKQILAVAVTVVFALLMLGCSGSTDSVDPLSPEASILAENLALTADDSFGGRHQHLALLADVLELTDAQREQAKAILQKHREDSRLSKGAGREGKSREEMRAQFKERGEALHSELLAILTPEQRSKAEAIRAKLEAGEIPQEFIDKHVERLTTELSLAPEQQEQVRQLLSESPPRGWRQRDGERGDRKASREEARARREEHHAKMKAILTDEQNQKFEALIAKRHEGMRERSREMRGHFSERRLEHLTSALSLTEAQQQQVSEIIEKAHASFDPEQFERGDRDAFREARKQHREQVEEQIRAVLTEEQRAKYDELKAERSHERHEFGPRQQ